MLEKQWKKIIIDGKETYYSVSNYGEVRNDSTGTLLGGHINNNGYKMVHLRYRIDKMCSVHRLVMKAFNPREDMDELQVNHIDGNKTNNYIENLEWSTALDNMRHSYITGLQPKKMYPCYQYDLEGNFIAEFINGAEAAKKLNLDYTTINKCMRNELQHYNQFQFKKYKAKKIDPWYNPQNKQVYVYSDNGEFIQTYKSQKECAKAFGVSPSSISRYISGVRKLNGFVFSNKPL